MNNNRLDISLSVTQRIFELLGYTITGSSTSSNSDIDIDIIHITLDKHLPSSVLEELTLSATPLIRSMTAQKTQEPESELTTVSLDINGHLTKLLDELRTHARLFADRAMTFGVPVHMKPLPAFHRKIIHSYLQKMPHIHTESFGVGKDRHIVITATTPE